MLQENPATFTERRFTSRYEVPWKTDAPAVHGGENLNDDLPICDVEVNKSLEEPEKENADTYLPVCDAEVDKSFEGPEGEKSQLKVTEPQILTEHQVVEELLDAVEDSAAVIEEIPNSSEVVDGLEIEEKEGNTGCPTNS